METYLNIAPLVITLVLIGLCVLYVILALFFLIRLNRMSMTRQLCVLHKFQRYCASIPRNESIPVTAVERLLAAVESADNEIDIDRIVIEEIFKTQKVN